MRENERAPRPRAADCACRFGSNKYMAPRAATLPGGGSGSKITAPSPIVKLLCLPDRERYVSVARNGELQAPHGT